MRALVQLQVLRRFLSLTPLQYSRLENPMDRGALVGYSVCVVVQAWVGKEFPDMRQNEREIKFIRMRDTVRTAGQLKGEW